jgi:apolipoprotein D and lipocalin family protein
MKKSFWIGAVLVATAAVVAAKSQLTIPKGAVIVKPFIKEKYLGKWYEIARLDFKYERNMNNVTATYSLNENGTIKVENRGYETVKKEWKTALGKARFTGATDEGRLKVSFFGPFYAAYNVIALDEQYKYALVCGKNLSYLWILSRETTVPEEVTQQYLDLAQKLGFDTTELIWVEHNSQQ